MSGISTNRTNITLPTEISAEILAKTQEQSAIMQLARKISLPGRGLSIPVIAGDPEANWVAETDKKPTSNPSLSTKTMTPYKLAVIVPFSDEFRRDAKALYDELVKRLPASLGKKFDETVFNGVAPGSGFDVLSGCSAQSISTGSPARGIYKTLVTILTVMHCPHRPVACCLMPLIRLADRSSSILSQRAESRDCSASPLIILVASMAQVMPLPVLPDSPAMLLLKTMSSDSQATGHRPAGALSKACRLACLIRRLSRSMTRQSTFGSATCSQSAPRSKSALLRSLMRSTRSHALTRN